MQTFLPFASFSESARALDMRRLGKQRVETYQILKALSDPSYGWQNHPCVKMWRGYEHQLTRYGIAICEEWRSRGYKDTLLDRFLAMLPAHAQEQLPRWLGDDAFHASHRATLLRKDPAHYSPLFPGSDSSLPVVWPAT